MRALRMSLVGTVILALFKCLSLAVVGQSETVETIGEPADSGARVIDVEELDERMVDLTIDSPAVGVRKARLLLPAGFDPKADADWPVLYLLHGGMVDYTSWTEVTDVAALTAELDLLVVMPDAGELGLYSDWWNAGEGGPPMWETFHLTELRQLLERNWQAGEDRAVAGFSLGGFGAMSYAGRHPEMFKAAASFSGVLHPLEFPPAIVEQVIDDAVWGSQTDQADIWAAHDPVSLAPALAGMSIYISHGDGQLGPLNRPKDGKFSYTEALLVGQNEAFVERLEELGIPATVDAYGPGAHTMRYAERALHEVMPLLMEALED